ncbi:MULTISPECIES: HAD family hydrolase [Kitasatospora]|uniref:HAD family hydrolase n=1 Tax=Kitasatospora TaxID=2063 RepID=UPI000CC9CF38|nr:HAD hydrolase-like protein [Kitasatospora sp. GP30]MDH6145859.1 phosphoglycolate phosphatase-like HAD superfamily hydrolase [Kitasatospora sp. GP30]
MLIFDFDGVLHDSRQRAWSCYQQARAELGLWELPSLTDPADLPLVYRGVLSSSLTRWTSYPRAEEFWQRHAELAAVAPESNGIVEELVPVLGELARTRGYAIVTGSHRSTVLAILGRDLPTESMPRELLSREQPGSKTDKLVKLRDEHGATAYTGDTGSDVRHARAAGLETVAVAYGYADLADLTAAAPDHLLTTPAELAAWCRAQLPSLTDVIPGERS